jgi:hypothetical protein
MTASSVRREFDGIHYETGNVHNLLSCLDFRMPHSNAAPSEALLLGLSGGITFGYFSFAYKGLDPFVALLTRNTFDPFETMLDRLGAVRTVKQTANAGRAEQNLLAALEAGGPALVWADRYSMPYFVYDGGLGDMYEMAPVLVLDFDTRGRSASIVDRSRVPLQVSAEALSSARARVKKDRFRLLTITGLVHEKLAANVQAALQASIKAFSGSPVKGYASNFGFAAYQRWADVLFNSKDKQSWDKVFPSGRFMYSALASAFERIELFGTGGAASRPLFAAFLEEAAVILERDDLRESAAQFHELAPAWGALGRALLPEEIAPFKQTRELLLQKRDLFYEQGGAAADQIRGIHTQLAQIRSSMESAFPLNASALVEFKENLRTHILGVHNQEFKAITSLGEILA